MLAFFKMIGNFCCCFSDINDDIASNQVTPEPQIIYVTPVHLYQSSSRAYHIDAIQGTYRGNIIATLGNVHISGDVPTPLSVPNRNPDPLPLPPIATIIQDSVATVGLFVASAIVTELTEVQLSGTEHQQDF